MRKEMKKQMKKIVVGVMAAMLTVGGISTTGTASAATAKVGATAALADTNYSLEEMLVYAISDEYLAKAEYDAIIGKYGVVKPFSNITKSETTHINLLLPLLKANNVTVPEKDWNSLVTVPTSLTAAYKIGVDAEKKNIAMYEKFLKEKLPADVKLVFEKLLNASKNHLRAFQNAVDRNGTGKGTGTGKGQKKKNTDNSGRGCGGNRNNSKGTCLIQ